MSFSAIMVKVQFPLESSIANKKMKLDASLTVAKTIEHIRQTVGNAVNIKRPGLYIAESGLWLEDHNPLSEYSAILQQAEIVEYKERGASSETSSTNEYIFGAIILAVIIGITIYISQERRT